ncbi:MAG: glycosyltransferase family 4 protein [Dissulfurispiraceae bacterium]
MMSYLATHALDILPVSCARAFVRRERAFRHGAVAHRGEPRQLLVDVSNIVQHDARTGIQRVVRGILLQLFNDPPKGYVVRPIFATVSHGYRYADITAECLQVEESDFAQAQSVAVCSGDIFLGLDLAAHLLPRHQGELIHWKRRGVRIAFMVYDILPVLHPHWFNPNLCKTFKKWLRTLAIYGDDLICISEVVRSDLYKWVSTRYRFSANTIRLHSIPLGADIAATMPSTGCSPDEQALLEQLCGKLFVLMVGTLEPRKGYAQALAAFEELWRNEHEIKLVIVGKPGWQTDALQERLRTHVERNRRLFWFDNASDELLQGLYQAAKGVLLASEAEGFGLPIAEAMYHGKPVLARDIPVFRESFPKGLDFFSGKCPSTLADTIAGWQANGASAAAVQNPQTTWKDSWRYIACILESWSHS